MAPQEEANFSGFIFPGGAFREEVIGITCRFNEATFRETAPFMNVTFEHTVDFSQAVFKGLADFRFVTFKERTNFEKCVFEMDGVFSMAVFESNAHFTETIFQSNAYFTGTCFKSGCYFSHVTFKSNLYFREAEFQESFWVHAAFAGYAYFEETKFSRKADWRYSKFLDSALFRSTSFGHEYEREPDADFRFVSFSKPEEIVFDDIDLRRVLFSDTDVTKLVFTSSVRWAERPDGRGALIFDEVWFLKYGNYEETSDRFKRRFQIIGQIYLQLVRNYDGRLNYWKADEFHVGIFEMQRLGSTEEITSAGWLRCIRMNLSLTALYRHASSYGNSYRRPLGWITLLVVVFGLIYPIVGLDHSFGVAEHSTTTYRNLLYAAHAGKIPIWQEAQLALKGILTSLDIATYQKSLDYSPTYPLGTLFQTIEMLSVSTLLALFLLAIRRKFRR